MRARVIIHTRVRVEFTWRRASIWVPFTIGPQGRCCFRLILHDRPSHLPLSLFYNCIHLNPVGRVLLPPYNSVLSGDVPRIIRLFCCPYTSNGRPIPGMCASPSKDWARGTGIGRTPRLARAYTSRRNTGENKGNPFVPFASLHAYVFRCWYKARWGGREGARVARFSHILLDLVSLVRWLC